MEFEKDGKKFNLLNEYLFPKIFGERGCESETLHLINTITGKDFTGVSYEPNEMEGLHQGNKKSNVDVLVLVNDGSIVNIESQIDSQKSFHKRSQLYNSKIYAVLIREGDDYDVIHKTYMINILDFNLLPIENYHSTMVLCDKKSNFILEDIIEIHYIELPKFRKKLRKGNINLNNPIDRIILFLNKSTSPDIIKKVINMDESVNKMYEKTLHVLQNQKEYLSYIRAEQAELDERARIKHASEKGAIKGEKIGEKKGKKIGIKIGIKKGEKIGIKKGEKIGEKKGEQIGIKKGKEEKKLEIAMKLKNEGISLETIAKTTGLTLSKIKKL